jgi:hypothetical protein
MKARQAALRHVVGAAFPIEPPSDEGEPPFLRQKGEIPDADDGVLEMGRDDREVFRVKGDKSQEIHGFSTG